MRVLVCGGRNYADASAVNAVLSRLAAENGALTIIQGGATGADALARQWWQGSGKGELITARADWKRHGRAAGPIRNQRMIDIYHPEIVVAFPGGRGTADMVSRAEANGVPVVHAGAQL